MKMSKLDGKSLYLPISQNYFNQLLSGERPKESRRVRATTYKKYLVREQGKLIYNAQIPHSEHCTIFDYNNGYFPFVPIDYKYLRLNVGYSKTGDNAIVSIKGITFDVKRDEHGAIMHYVYTPEHGMVEDTNGSNVFWYIYYEIGEFIELNQPGKIQLG